MKQLAVAIQVCVVMSVVMFSVVSAAADLPVVSFADCNLEQAVREALQKSAGFITASDMASLVELDGIPGT